MKRIINAGIHCLLLTWIPLSFDTPLHIIFTITFTISIFVLVWEPIAELRLSRKLRKIDFKNEKEIKALDHQTSLAEANGRLAIAQKDLEKIIVEDISNES